MIQRAIYVRSWRVDITIRDAVNSHLPVPASRLAQVCATTLDVAGARPPASLGLILSDDAELAELNREEIDS